MDYYIGRNSTTRGCFCAINGKQVVVTFNKAVDASTVFSDQATGTLATAVTVVRTVAAVAPDDLNKNVASVTGELSADGKTLTLTAATTTYFNGTYAVTIANSVKDLSGNAFAAYSGTVTVADSARPAVTGVKYLNKNTARVSFSEPLASYGTVTYTLADGTTVSGASATLGTNYVDVDLSSVAVANENKNITVTFVGATDFNGNLATPNPLKVTVKKDTTDTTAPTFTVTPTASKTFDVKFSEALDEFTAPDLSGVTIGGETITNFVQDSKDATLYHATLSATVSGLQTVAFGVDTFFDKGLVGNAAYSKLLSFDVNTAGPKVVSTSVQKINGVENLIVNFDKNVNVVDAKAISGTFVKDYVTTGVTLETETTANGGTGGVTLGNVAGAVSLYNAVGGNSKSIAISLAGATDGAYTVALPSGLVTDAVTGVDSDAVSNVGFTRASDSNTVAPNVTSLVKSATDNNKVVVTFDSKVDPTTALNKANYSIEGATVEGTKLTSNGATATVELTLAKDSNTFNGLHLVKVTGVKNASGVVQNAYSANITLNENVRPTVTKAELTSDTTITLTTSEAVYNASGLDDFDVYVGGVKLPSASTAAVTTASNQLVITVSALTAAQVASGIVVKPTANINVNDATLAGAASATTTGNALNFTSINVQ